MVQFGQVEEGEHLPLSLCMRLPTSCGLLVTVEVGSSDVCTVCVCSVYKPAVVSMCFFFFYVLWFVMQPGLSELVGGGEKGAGCHRGIEAKTR